VPEPERGRPFFAAFYSCVGRLAERGPMSERRRALLANAIGVTVEIGAGTGLNARHYPASVSKVVAVEPNPHMLRRLRRAAADARVPLVVQRGSAEDLPLDAGFADTVVSTLVLCSVEDPAAALGEIRRILKPNGRFLFLEHVRADDPGLARWQDRLERPWGWFGGGCHPNRDSEGAIRDAGFDLVEVERFDLPGVALVRPHVAGVASP
jgi:ubiquinone/menaquinone biosynthesis C-methylase UbiE